MDEMERQSLGEIISRLRKEQGMTQKDLAARMNVTDKAVSKWERNLSCPDIHVIPKLAETLGVSVEVLLSTSSKAKRENEELAKAADIILKAIPLAMGVAVFVLAAMKEIELYSGLSMLAIGLFCIAVDLLRSR